MVLQSRILVSDVSNEKELSRIKGIVVCIYGAVEGSKAKLSLVLN
jgi:hypothetical protein